MSQPTGTVEITATLTDNADNPLAGKTISLSYKLSAAADWTSIGSFTTDANGTVTTTISLSAPNTYDFQAEFAGDEQYQESSAQAVNIAVRAGTIIKLIIQQ